MSINEVGEGRSTYVGSDEGFSYPLSHLWLHWLWWSDKSGVEIQSPVLSLALALVVLLSPLTDKRAMAMALAPPPPPFKRIRTDGSVPPSPSLPLPIRLTPTRPGLSPSP